MLVTPDSMWELGYADSSTTYDAKRFELCDGVRVMFFACAGPKCWECEVWIGNASHKIINPTLEHIADLIKALRLPVKP